MHHITMNNSACTWAPWELMDPKILAILADKVQGGALPTKGQLWLERLPNPLPHVAVWSMLHGPERRVLVTAMQCWNTDPEQAAAAWSAMEQAWFTASDAYPTIADDCDLVKPPPGVPWLSVILWPTVTEVSEDVRKILEPLERHIAWTVMERERSYVP